MSGKAYANRKTAADRPQGDFYATPRSLVWAAEKLIKKEFKIKKCKNLLEPANGLGDISEELIKIGYNTIRNDLYSQGRFYKLDYLNQSFFDNTKHIITNPPFSLWDNFVNKSKSHCKKFMFIGRLNYLGTCGRSQSGIWNNLKSIHIFNRYVDYRTPARKDGLFHVGAMATAWFLWDMKYKGKPTFEILDVQKWAKLGGFKE